MMRNLNAKMLCDMLTNLGIDGNEIKNIVFDVKSVESCQDMASLAEMYEDGEELVLVLH